MLRLTATQPGTMDPPVDGYRQPVRTAVIHPILVGLTEWRDQRIGWLAWRSAVDL